MDHEKEFPLFVDKLDGYQPYYSQETFYAIERDFDERAWHEFSVRNWTWSLYASVVYVVMVFGGRYYMKDRPRFELRAPLAVWSSCLAAFSIMGMARCVPEFLYLIRTVGYEQSVCNPAYTFLNPSSFAFWKCVFIISKFFELGDTAFIVLRKQPFIFLHWYHHITVMIYSWWSFTQWTAAGRWYVAMNFSVHSLMYSYYALRAMKIRLPKMVSLVITILQIVQMVLGIVLSVSAYVYKGYGMPCQQTYVNIFFTLAMYGSYFVLFAHFFLQFLS